MNEWSIATRPRDYVQPFEPVLSAVTSWKHEHSDESLCVRKEGAVDQLVGLVTEDISMSLGLPVFPGRAQQARAPQQA